MNKVLAGEAGKEKAREWGRWLATDEGQAYLAAQMDADFFEERENMDDGICEESRKRVFCNLQKKISRRRFAGLTLKVVAAMVPVAAVIAILLYLNMQVSLFEPPFYQDIYVAKGERMQIAFQDGTRVYLYPGSRLCYPDKFGLTERRVTLDGEAYFEVSKNSHRPFIVDLDKASIRVTGTSFHLQAYACEPDITVELDEGQVDLLYGDRQEYSLRPGESLIYNKVKNACMLQLQEGVSGLIRWKEQEIDFRNTPMKEVLKELDLHYGVPFWVGDTVVYQYSYTFCVKKASLEEVMKTLEIISPVRFQKGDTIRVRMK